MMRRLLGRRRAAPIQMLKVFGVLFFVLAVLASCSPSAFAAAERRPVVKCDSTVRWYAETTYGGWDTGNNAIAWAYEQVAPVAGITTINDPEARVVWEWQSPMSGSSYNPGKDYWEETLLSDRRYWVHAKNGDSTEFDSRDNTRQVVLRDIVRDFGVPSPTSTAAGLSNADRSAIRGVCQKQSHPDSATSRNGDDGTSQANGRDNDGTTTDEPGAPEASAWASSVAAVAVLAVMVGLLAFLVAPGLVSRAGSALTRTQSGVWPRRAFRGRVGARATTWSGGGDE